MDPLFSLWQNTGVEVVFSNHQLEARFESLAAGTRAWGEVVAKSYQRRVTFLIAAATVQQLRDHRSLRLHQLAAPHAGKYSIVLHGRWRLVVSLSEETILIEEVSNQYGD